METLILLINEYGLWVLAFSFFLDDIGLPFPSSALLIFYAGLLGHGVLEQHLVFLFIIAIFVPSLANNLLYFWGRRGAKNWIKKNGHKFFLPQKRLDKIEHFLEKKHGGKTIFFSSLVNNVRPFVALIAGTMGLAPKKFITFNLLGVACWASFNIIVGYFFGGEIWSFILTHWPYILVIVLGGLLAYLLNRRHRSRS